MPKPDFNLLIVAFCLVGAVVVVSITVLGAGVNLPEYPILVISGIVVVMLGASGAFFLRAFETQREPSQLLIEHRKNLIAAYLEGNTHPANPWGLLHSSYKDRMFEHFKTGYRELKIPESYAEWDSLFKECGKLQTSLHNEISEGLEAIRKKHSTPPDRIYNTVIFNRIIGKVGTPDWTDYTTSATDNPVYTYVMAGTDCHGSLWKGDEPSEYVNEINALAKKVTDDALLTRRTQAKEGDASTNCSIGLQSFLDSVKISPLKGKCKDCPPS